MSSLNKGSWESVPGFHSFQISFLCLNQSSFAAGFHRQVNLADMFFLGVFTIEILVKVIAMGMVANERCFLREGWNR